MCKRRQILFIIVFSVFRFNVSYTMSVSFLPCGSWSCGAYCVREWSDFHSTCHSTAEVFVQTFERQETYLSSSLCFLFFFSPAAELDSMWIHSRASPAWRPSSIEKYLWYVALTVLHITLLWRFLKGLWFRTLIMSYGYNSQQSTRKEWRVKKIGR